MIMNVCRERGADVFGIWAALFSTENALKCSRTVPPQCLPGKWGSVDQCEERLLGPPHAELCQVFPSALQVEPPQTEQKRRSQAGTGAAIDRERELGQENYREQMGCRARNSLEALPDLVFVQRHRACLPRGQGNG